MKREAMAPGAGSAPASAPPSPRARSIWEFDHGFSAPRNGFRRRRGLLRAQRRLAFLDGIAVPTLVIHALDDPWIPPDGLSRL